MHTCYSPVRRSPAKVSKLTPPLPLDLHVLSLSLAFILSQDQTLRCCLSCLFSFSYQKKQKTKTCLSLLFCLHGTAASWQCGPLGLFSMTASSERSCHRLDSGFTRGRPCGRRLVNLLGIEQSRLLLQTCSCTTLCLYCKSFNVLSVGPPGFRALPGGRSLGAWPCSLAYFPKASAKLQPFFLPRKYFHNYFQLLTSFNANISRKNH